MFEFHGDRRRYFDIQVNNTRKYVIPFIEQHKPVLPGTRVLEIGCGEAGVLKAFTDMGCVGVGVELDEPRLINAREWMQDELQAGKVSFVSKDIYKVNAQQEFNGTFDIIILKDVIEHIHDHFTTRFVQDLQLILIIRSICFFPSSTFKLSPSLQVKLKDLIFHSFSKINLSMGPL